MKCFVISPIGDENSPVREHADEVFAHVIEPALAKFGIQPIRSDHMSESGKISDQMFRAIWEYDLCIAVLTYSNPNVYYELAIAQSAPRPVLILVQKGHPLPFDVADIRSIEYDLTITSYKNRVHIDRLERALDQLKQNNWKGQDLFLSYRTRSATASRIDLEACEIQITSPTNGSIVDVVTVEGTYSTIPENYELRPLRFYPDQMAYVPTGAIAIDKLKKCWKVPRFDVGGESGDNRGIEIALAGPDARIFLDYWAEAHQVHKLAIDEVRSLKGKFNRWLPMIRKWPTDLLTCARVEVKRK